MRSLFSTAASALAVRVVAVLLAAAGLGLVACGGSASPTPPPLATAAGIDDSQAGGSAWSEGVWIQAGGQVTIIEAEDPATGYRWSLRLPPGVTQVSSVFTAPSPSASSVVAPVGTRTFVIKVGQGGVYDVIGAYARLSKPAQPAKTFTVSIFANPPSLPVPRVVFTEKESPGRLAADVGTVFTIVLKENPSTGYLWAMKLGPGLELLSDQFVAPSASRSPIVGAGGQHLWVIKVEKAGTTAVTGIYARPSEAATKSAASFSQTITAK